jgi:hypothetical protein
LTIADLITKVAKGFDSIIFVSGCTAMDQTEGLTRQLMQSQWRMRNRKREKGEKKGPIDSV